MDQSHTNWDDDLMEADGDAANYEQGGSVIKHLISQIRIGMDLTKVVLPTFILERRSLLEMYADFFAHPDLFSSIPDQESAQDRFVQLVRWYLSAFHAGRKSSVAKKPYNPVLGETFICHWNLGEGQSLSNGNGTRVETETKKEVSLVEAYSSKLSDDNLLFVSEQVSHHPPVSAFYAENRAKRISCCAHIYTKSKFLGLSVGVMNVGNGTITLHDKGETYTCTFPSAFGRSILSVPWVELGGSVEIKCIETGYKANIEFLTKPFYGGKKHRISGDLIDPKGEVFMNLDGEWNGCMYSKDPKTSVKNIFVDTTKLLVIPKQVTPIDEQEPYESRNVWKQVTRALKQKDVATATEFKTEIEQRQRDSLKERTESGIPWQTRAFEQAGDGWKFRYGFK